MAASSVNPAAQVILCANPAQTARLFPDFQVYGYDADRQQLRGRNVVVIGDGELFDALTGIAATTKLIMPNGDTAPDWDISSEDWTPAQAIAWCKAHVVVDPLAQQNAAPLDAGSALSVSADNSTPEPSYLPVTGPEPPGSAAPDRGYMANVVSLADHVNGLLVDGIDTDEAGSESTGEAPPAFSEDAIAAQFTRMYGKDWRYVAEWGCWFHWDGEGWRRDDTLLLPDQIRDVCRFAVHWDIAKDLTQAAKRTLASAKTHRAVESIAKTDREHALTSAAFDSDVWLLGAPNGVVDLRTGVLRHADRTDYITKRTAVSPGGDCPRWREFLHQVTNDDDNLEAYLQRLAGYCLTGTFTEQMFAFLYGTGGNGKGVFIRQLLGLMGDYATTASMDTFTESHNQRHETEFARLHGMRLVSAQETEEGRRWAQAKIQELTGGDKITTRFMRKDHFTYQPQFKLIFVGNHKPSLRSVNDAIKRRCHLVPFTRTVKVEDQDTDLDAKLKLEWPGILQWAIEGCLEFQKVRLMPPFTIMEATKDYLQSEDILLQWIDECCEADESYRCKSGEMYKSYQAWCDQQGERANSSKRFLANLKEKNYKVTKVTGYNTVFGLKLKQSDEPPEWLR